MRVTELFGQLSIVDLEGQKYGFRSQWERDLPYRKVDVESKEFEDYGTSFFDKVLTKKSRKIRFLVQLNKVIT